MARDSSQHEIRAGKLSGSARNRLFRWVVAIAAVVVAVTWCWRSYRQSLPEPLPGTEQSVSSPREEPDLQPPPTLPPTVDELIDEATAFVTRLVEQYPGDGRTHQLMGRVKMFLGDTAAAEKSWVRCLELPGDHTLAHEGLGKIAMMKGDYDRAVRHWKTVLTAQPGMVETSCLLAETLMRQRQPDEAVATLKATLQAVPRAAPCYASLGKIYLERQRWDEARQCFEQALSFDPDLDDAHFGLATALMRSGHPDEAKLHLERFRELTSQSTGVPQGVTPDEWDYRKTAANFSVAYTQAGEIYVDHGRADLAEQAWRWAAQANDQNAACRHYLAQLYSNTQRHRAAAMVRQELVEIEPERPENWWQLGASLGRLGRFDEASRAFRRLAELAPENPLGYVGLAEVYAQQNRQLDEAERLVRRAIELHADPSYYLLLARIARQRQDTATMQWALERARQKPLQ